MSSVKKSGARDGIEWGLRGWQGRGRSEKRLPSSGMSTNGSSTKCDMVIISKKTIESDGERLSRGERKRKWGKRR
jgi:hypothetical protein